MDSTLIKGLTMLEVLAKSPGPRGISDLAGELQLTKSNVHRTLQTLVAAGYVRPSEGTGTYECTLKLFELASSVMSRLDVPSAADSYMHALASETNETVHLAMLDGLEVIYVHKIESQQPVRAYSAIGGRAPAHCVATGKALLAYQDGGGPTGLPDRLPRHTGRTITGRDELLGEFASVRRQGYAINRGEWRESVCGLAAIVLDAAGRPTAAIGISGPAERLRVTALRRYAPVVVDAARSLSERLGCTRYDQVVREYAGGAKKPNKGG
ncbi:IclR family transcriptional regulator [Actinoallomurus oryzae]|jgi:DNA-binding IclR family transcriptional regulator|uniref:IclR family transcriptional regulator n=1 Tax=Actinoallomurus oryzae TaxID=502180 RepID=A0ABP8QZS3_9ACTN